MRLTSCLVFVVWAVAGVVDGGERPLRMAKPLELTEGWGTIEGQFVLDGDVPAPAGPIANPGGIPIPDERLLIDQETKGIANIVIYLRKAPASIHPELKQSKNAVVDFKLEDFRFKPRMLHVRTDQRIRCISVNGNVENLNVSPFANNAANFMFGGEYGDVEFTMQRPEILPTWIRSDLRTWTQSYWMVTDHPYVGITDDLGHFRIEGLPAEEHRFSIWHERVGSIDRAWTVQVRSKELLTLPAVKVPISKFKVPG